MIDIQVDSLDFTEFHIKDKNGSTESFDIRDELRITEETIKEDLMNQSAKYAYWSSILERARAYQESEERKLDQVSSSLNLSVRQQFEQQGKKPTKDMVDSAITLDSNYQQQAKKVDNWSYKVRQLQYIVKAFEQRMNAMIQINADLRKTNAHGGITNPFAH